MGTSTSKKKLNNPNVNIDQNNLKNSARKENDDAAAPPISLFMANPKDERENGKNIPENLDINSESINNNKININPSDNSNSIILRNKEYQIKGNNPKNNNFSLFNEENLTELNQEKNIFKNSDNIINDKKKVNNNNKTHLNANNEKGNIDNLNGLNFLDSELSLSKYVYDSEDNSLEHPIKMIQIGYIPIFIKLQDYKPYLFYVKENAKLKSLVEAYIQSCPGIDEEIINHIKLYNEKRLLDINKIIKNLSLSPFSIITDKIE